MRTPASSEIARVLLPMCESNRASGRSNREGWEIAGGRHGDTPKIVAGVRAAEGVVEAQLGTGRAIGCCRGVRGGLEITGCTRYRGHRADIVVYNCWPPLPYHHLHFSGPSSSSSHPLHYPGDPYYVNSVASEMCVRSADKSSGHLGQLLAVAQPPALMELAGQE